MNPYIEKKKTMMTELNLLKKGVRDFESEMKEEGYKTCTHLSRDGESLIMPIGVFEQLKCGLCFKEIQ